MDCYLAENLRLLWGVGRYSPQMGAVSWLARLSVTPRRQPRMLTRNGVAIRIDNVDSSI